MCLSIYRWQLANTMVHTHIYTYAYAYTYIYTYIHTALPELVIADMRDELNMKRFNFRDFHSQFQYENTINANNANTVDAEVGVGVETDGVNSDGHGNTREKEKKEKEDLQFLSDEEPLSDHNIRNFLYKFDTNSLKRSLFSESPADLDDTIGTYVLMS